MALEFSLGYGGVEVLARLLVDLGVLARFLVALEFSLGYNGVEIVARYWVALEFALGYGGVEILARSQGVQVLAMFRWVEVLLGYLIAWYCFPRLMEGIHRFLLDRLFSLG